jgi:hypothetical protein
MGIKLGFEAKLYFCAAGIGGTPTWTELATVKDVTLNVQATEADVSTRANAPWKAVIGGLKEANIEFDMPWDTAATGFSALRDAFLNSTAIGLAVMDGPIATAGSQGLWADCAILKFDRQEKLAEDLTVSISAKPTYSANAPQWKTIAGA